MTASRFSVRSFSASLVFALSLGAVAQSADDKPKIALNSSNTIQLRGKATVQESVQSCIAVEAVLLSRKPVMAMFSGYVADNYAVVQVTISNKCSDQQFLLHDIFFDYSNWSLSGVFKGFTTVECGTRPSTPKQDQTVTTQKPPAKTSPGSDAATQNAASNNEGAPSDTSVPPPPLDPNNDCLFQKGTRPGQVATVGALDIQQQLQEASIFSPRNLTINSLEILTSTAQAFAFPFTGDVSKGVGAFNTGLVTPLGKWWKDRSIDQSNYILKRGYRTDQTTAIAKDDHGSFYAFFPLNTFLVPDLKALFQKSPAIFLTPGEVAFSNQLDGAFKERDADKGGQGALRAKLLTLARTIVPNAEWSDILMAVSSPCVPDDAKDSKTAETDGCLMSNGAPLQMPVPTKEPPYPASPQILPVAGSSGQGMTFAQVIALKYFFAHASLNSVQIVARGVMTMDVSAIPPTIDTVTFENESKGASLWTGGKKPASSPEAARKGSGSGTKADSAKADDDSPAAAQDSTEMTGTITGKFLQGGVPAIGPPVLPKTSTGKTAPKFSGLTVDKTKATDTSMPFKVTRVGDTPNGTKLPFTVSRTSTNQDSGSDDAGPKTEVTSNKYDYTVSYESGPKITKVAIEDESTAWYKTGTIAGTITGTDLSGTELPDVTISLATLTIGGKPATLDDYISAGKVTLTSDSDDSRLDFNFKLAKAVESGKLVTLDFTVTTKSGKDSSEYKQAAPATPAKKTPATKSKKAAAAKGKATGK